MPLRLGTLPLHLLALALFGLLTLLRSLALFRLLALLRLLALFHLLALVGTLALLHLLTLLHLTLSGLSHGVHLALRPLTVRLMRFAYGTGLLAHLPSLLILPLPTLPIRVFALLQRFALLQAFAKLHGLAPLLFTANLPVAIFAHHVRDRVPVMYRRMRSGRSRLIVGPFDARRAILPAIGCTRRAFAQCLSNVRRGCRAARVTRGGRRRIPAHDDLAIRDGRRRHAHVRSRRSAQAALAHGRDPRRHGARDTAREILIVDPHAVIACSARRGERVA